MKTTKSHWPLSLLGGGVSFINLITPLILVRMLSAEDVGRYKVFFLYLVLMPWLLLTAGIPNGLSHWAGYDGRERSRAFHTSWTLLVTASLLFLGLGLAFHAPLAATLQWGATDTNLFIFAAFFTLLASFYEEAAISQGKIWTGALFSSGFDLIRNFAIIGAALTFRTIQSAFWAHTVLMGAKLGLGLILGHLDGFNRFYLNKKVVYRVVRYAFPVSVAAAFTILTDYTDQLLLSRILPEAQFAIYALGCLTVPPLFIFEQSVNRVLIPRMARCFTLGSVAEARRILREGISELSWILFPASIGMFIFARPIIVLLFTEKYLDSVIYLRLFASSYFVMAIPYDIVARARGAGSWILGHLGFFSMLTVALSYLFGRAYGAPGVLVGMLTSKILMRVIAVVRVRRAEKWSWSDMLPWADWGAYFSVILLSSAVAWALKTPTGGGIHWLLIGGGAYTVIYFVGTAARVLQRRAAAIYPKRVIMLTQYLSLGGLERVILSLSEGLKIRGEWEPSVFVYDRLEGSATLHPEFAKKDIPVTDFAKAQGFSPRAVLNLAWEVVRGRVAVIHSHDLGALIYAVMTKLILLGGVRVVHTQHSFIHLDRDPRYKKYERWFSFLADSLCTVSDGLREQYRSVGIQPSSIERVENGVVFPIAPPPATAAGLSELRSTLIEQIESPELRARLTQRNDRIWVLCMARVHAKKGQEQIIDLWAGLDPDIRRRAFLIFVGQETSAGAVERMNEKICALSEPDEVAYVGYTRHGGDWLQACEIFVSGSEFEGMPLGPIEAAGAGMKLLLSDIPGHEMVPGAPLRFDVLHPGSESAKLEQLIKQLGDREQSLKVRMQGWTHAESIRLDFGIEAMALRYHRPYAASSVSIAARLARLARN